MTLPVGCDCGSHTPQVVTCTEEGYMNFKVYRNVTRPPLNLDTVHLRDPSCQANKRAEGVLHFSVPLQKCGTRFSVLNGKAVYENEVRALWADLPPSHISRDSEYRVTILCYYWGNGTARLTPKILTLSPPLLATDQGVLVIVLRLYPDESYQVPYSDQDYPIVKYLRQPIYLEVQVLHRSDPNIELVLDDCWATASSDPRSLPQWNVVIDGCENEGDYYKTRFHKIASVSGVQYPSHYKRFEVKTFTFMAGDAALSSSSIEKGLVLFWEKH
nr:PREDICTED: zona pellucida sperm-binding protein 2-like [Latimeria chalumnae]|eukprot:XP_014347799.1 PREDICTED: zona pellucida sperm-binding protein 2-like [Latimeria chalumnae]